MDFNKPFIITCRQAQELANKLKQHKCYQISAEVELMICEALEGGKQTVLLDKTYLKSAYDNYIIHGK